MTRDESQRSHVYAPAQSQDMLQTHLLKDLIAKAFSGSGKALVLAALKGQVSKKERADRQPLALDAELAAQAPHWRLTLQSLLPELVLTWSLGVAAMALRLGLRCSVPLQVVDQLDSPLTVGWWRPVILLPASLISSMPAPLLEAHAPRAADKPKPVTAEASSAPFTLPVNARHALVLEEGSGKVLMAKLKLALMSSAIAPPRPMVRPRLTAASSPRRSFLTSKRPCAPTWAARSSPATPTAVCWAPICC